MRNAKILILGHGEHGKDTVAELISAMVPGMEFISSSQAALNAIYPVISLVLNEHDPEVLFATRHENRELWKRCISLYNAADRSALCRKIISENDIYVGMRCDLEYKETCHLFDYILWVDATERKPTEPSMKIEFDRDKMTMIDNNTNQDNLFRNVHGFLFSAGFVT